MVGEDQKEDRGEVLEFEKMLVQGFGNFGERGMVDELYGALGRLNGRAKEMAAAVILEMEVYSLAYPVMAGEKEDHSVSTNTVEIEEALAEVL